MSVIQTIRDRAWIIVAAIAVALIAFIAQDAFQGGGGVGLFGGQSTTLGKVDGVKIDYADFQRRFDQIEQNFQAQNMSMDDQTRERYREDLWNMYVEEALLSDDIDELGLSVPSKELGDMLYGPNPAPQMRQLFRDSTGAYDPELAYRTISSFPKNSPQYNYVWNQLVPDLERNRLREKFTMLLAKSAYVPKWLVEKTNSESSQRSNISYVYVPYTSIADSTVNVTNEEVREYVNNHSKLYRQEKARGIQYVSFDAGPTAEDSAEVLNQVVSQKDAFAQAEDPQAFLLGNSETAFNDGYVHSSKMQMPNADSLKALPVGQIFGPYIDGGQYVLAKKIDEKSIPDSVKSRHILIKVADQNGQTRPDSTAKKLIDSIENAIRSGTPFDSLVVKFSEDDGSNRNGGVYEHSFTNNGPSSLAREPLTREFAETIFFGKTGDKKVVYVQSPGYIGYHYIEVLSQWKFELAYKIAYLSKSIVPSQQTTNAANGLASQFVAESRTPERFEENAKKRNLNVFNAVDIKPLASMILGVGNSRDLVKWIFKADKGDVAETPFMVGDKFIVPMVTQIYEEGVMDVDRARSQVEFKIRNEKKAEQIRKKIGSAATLEAVSQAVGQPVQKADSLSAGNGSLPGIGFEPRVIGAAFNTGFQNKVSPIINGENGVFVIRVENISAVPNPGFDAVQMRQGMEQQQENNAFRIVESLKKAATIKDYRAEFF